MSIGVKASNLQFFYQNAADVRGDVMLTFIIRFDKMYNKLNLT